MNPRIKQGWDYFWKLKPSQVGKMENEKLIAQLHYWMKLIVEEFNSEQPEEKDLETLVKEIFK